MSFELTDEEGIFLVKLARRAIETYLKSGEVISPTEAREKLKTMCGVFTTLNKVGQSGHELRGCIGLPYPIKPLDEAVISSAISAAVEDPRFEPVSVEEMNNITIELSVLTPPEVISVKEPSEFPREVEVGRDGLIIERGARSGLLLPQVPIEWGWDCEEFLTQCCIKAWLSPDAWLMKGTKISKFQAIIFAEREPRGEIEKKKLSE